ncbi:hypothetical protein D3C87_968660 [compost metagenome]
MLKKLVFAIVFFVCSLNSFAGDPGSNYACWEYGANNFYTHYWKDDTYSNWGSTQYHYYDNASGVITGTYNNSPNCGEINPNNPGGVIVWSQGGGSCFININGSIYQGNLGTIDYSNYNQCNVPLDESIVYLLIVATIFGFGAVRLKYFHFN